MTHKCPVDGCNVQVPHNKLMCRPHWWRVPPALRNAVYGAWDDGAGGQSDAHREACEKAIAWVNRSIQRKVVKRTYGE